MSRNDLTIKSLIKRRFTHELESIPQSNDVRKTVYDLFQWKKVSVHLTDYKTGKVITDLDDLEFPESYSQTACDIIASKYFRKKGVPNERGCEYSMKQLAHRMIEFWVRGLLDEGIISETEKDVVYDELVFTFLSQMWAPNSPQWFNTGLALAYGITGGSQGHYYYDPVTGKEVLSDDAYTRTQGSACFIIGVEDSLLGEKSLTDQITTETRLFKYGSGVGTNWSPIRAKNEFLSGGGKSSGLISFLKVSDRNAGAIKSGGTTRRAAKMNILDLDHPEIMDYIQWKSKEEEKVTALSKMGYSAHFEGEAYDTVSGQNANNSVRISDKFMNSIADEDAVWNLVGRIDRSADSQLRVTEVWDEIAKAAWRCGDPGVQFDDVINAWHTCPAGEDGRVGEKHNRINASNPCSEYMFLDDTSCNLASLNLTKFYDYDNDCFLLDDYLHVIMLTQLVLESTIHWGQFPTKDIARKTHLFRTTGLGLSNMGMLFMQAGIAYDSDEARNIAAAVMSILTGYSYNISALMAAEVGAFDRYAINAPHMCKVIRNHARAAGNEAYGDFDNNVSPVVIQHDVLAQLGYNNLCDTLSKVWNDAIANGDKYGYRNAQVSVLAPTGTISFTMDCASTSSEPFFSHVAYKKLVGGGYMEIVNPAFPLALKKLGYTQKQTDEIIAYVMRKEEDEWGYSNIADGKVEGAPHLLPEHLPVFDTANKCGTGTRYILPEGHVKMMGALSPHVSGAISKTVNMPNDASVDDVKRIYELSWQLGVKAIALYRDGCKASQPLNTTRDENKKKPLEDYSYAELLEYINTKMIVYKPHRIKPTGIRTAHVHEAQINGLKLYITTSFYENGRLGELYVSSGRQGTLVKGLLESISQTISEMLQYGVPPEDVARMYRGQKFEPSGFVSGHPYIKSVDSISDLISKVIDIELGNFTFCQVKPSTDGQTESNKQEPQEWLEANIGQPTAADYLQGEVCPTCKSAKLVKNGTCKVCIECGTTTGCS